MWFGLGREMPDTVFLDELRCDGGGHGGCEADCLIFFKLQWLKPVAPARDWNLPPTRAVATPGRNLDWLRATVVKDGAGESTHLPLPGDRAPRCVHAVQVQRLVDVRSRFALG